MTLEQDIDEQIDTQEQIIAEVPKKIAQLEAVLQEMRGLVSGARYASTILKAIKLKNAVPPQVPAMPTSSTPFHDGQCICESSPPGFVASDGIHCGSCGGVVKPPATP